MPLYEYRCRACGQTFERLRPASEADAPAACDDGHDDTTRLLSLIAAPRTSSAGPAPGSGTCCGGTCCG